MTSLVHIDVTLDLRADAKGGDPDRYSATLRTYHQKLWSKPLPSGEPFRLVDAGRSGYLVHDSELGRFPLSSDTVLRTFTHHSKMQHIIAEVPEPERAEFLRRGYTIGGMLVFPGHRIENRQTINQARGRHPKIQDRFDLTLECIRRYYLGQDSPLSAVLSRYADFFALFRDFRGYVDFFLLNDLTTEDYGGVRFFLPFDDFGRTQPLPRDLAEYVSFRTAMLDWIEARNRRIAAWQDSLPQA